MLLCPISRADAQAIRIAIKLVRPNDCSLCDGSAQAERRPSLCLGIKWPWDV